ncbi:ATP-binding protein [Streptosporangium sp. NPDC087985]|uniref:ATP-binding protein n=1 Tax=Streptosporangium sp. NPDC087985 TaxID=3366196 RepID=UPI0038117DA8
MSVTPDGDLHLDMGRCDVVPQWMLDAGTPIDGWKPLGGYHVLVRILQAGTASRRARTLVREVLSKAGAGDEEINDAETAIAELAANAEEHACGPFELRIVSLGGQPAWCEIADGDRDLDGIPAILDRLRACGDEPGLSLFAEHGRGLLLVHLLSGGRCQAYQTRMCATGTPGKAVGFALPAKTSPRSSAPVPNDGLPRKAGAHLPPGAPAFPDHHPSS